MHRKTEVFIVDDSAVIRQVLKEVINADKDLTVIGVASDPIFAREKLNNHWPDVIVLDIEMPRMDGISFLKTIMAERPTPVVICSTLTEKGADISVQAMNAGAVSIVTKPRFNLKDFVFGGGANIIEEIKAAAQANVKPLVRGARSLTDSALVNVVPSGRSGAALSIAKTTERIVALGTSTGGTQALEAVLRPLPRVCPGIVVVQHMPAAFTAAFAERLNGICEIEVKEAENNDRVLPGRALIAPGGFHMRLKRSGAQYVVEIIEGPPVNRHKPSVDVLFNSVASTAGENAMGVIMTGMGDDGARGMLEMRRTKSYTLAQDEDSCVVFGMPKEAIRLKAVEKTVPLSTISSEILNWYNI